MIYTVRNIAEFCDVDFGFIRRIIDSNELRPKLIYGNANEKKGYTFYQLYIIKELIEQLIQKDIYLDFENEEVYTIYQSKLNEL
jgi:hypothetical protein